MDILSQVLLVVMMVMVGVTAIFVPYAIVRNVRQGLKYREALARRIEPLRIGPMLRALGVDRGAYLHEQPVVRISAQMRKCDECSTHAVCDDRMAAILSVQQIDFCPNRAELAELTRAVA